MAGLSKGDFDKAGNLIVLCRKRGLLPLDIVAEDERRSFYNVQNVCDDTTPQEYAEALLMWAFGGAGDYFAKHFWEDQQFYVQMVVEKIDLRELFSPVCKKFYLPIANSGGWGNLHVRAEMMERFKYWDERGKRLVLLYCGDFDPGGMLISDSLMANMRELEVAVGWDPSSVIIDRFGLNLDFIEENGLSWIPNLITGSGNNLASPKHNDYHKEYVQRWLREVGERKVEANALVTRPDAGKQLCRDAITKYVDAEWLDVYEEQAANGQGEVRSALDGMVPNAPWN